MVRFVERSPIVLDYAGITYVVRPHPTLSYVAVFFGDRRRHFKVSETFSTVADAETAFEEGFEVRLCGPMETLFDELIRRGVAEYV